MINFEKKGKEYLDHEWSLKVKDDFIKKLNKSLKQFRNFPESCQKTNVVKGLHMLVVTKQTSFEIVTVIIFCFTQYIE